MRVRRRLRAFILIYARSEDFTHFPQTHIKNRLNVRAGWKLIITNTVNRDRFGDVIDDPARTDQADC